MLNIYFLDQDLEELVRLGKNKGKYKKYGRDPRFLAGLAKVFQAFNAVDTTDELFTLSYLHYERLKGIGKSSVRVLPHKVERIIFTESEDRIEIELIALDTEHYGNKK